MHSPRMLEPYYNLCASSQALTPTTCSLVPPVCAAAGRHLYSAVTGVLLVYYPFGNSTAELLIPAAVTYVAMLRLRQHATTLAWLITFGFLLYWCAYVMALDTGGACNCCAASCLCISSASVEFAVTSDGSSSAPAAAVCGVREQQPALSHGVRTGVIAATSARPAGRRGRRAAWT